MIFVGGGMETIIPTGHPSLLVAPPVVAHGILVDEHVALGQEERVYQH